MWDDLSLVLQKYILQNYLKTEDLECPGLHGNESEQTDLLDGVLSVLERVSLLLFRFLTVTFRWVTRVMVD